jgi:4'-phosphopantetheinyl transferase
MQYAKAFQWPTECEALLTELRLGHCAVLYVVLPLGTDRTSARLAIRNAIHQVLAHWLRCEPEAIALHSRPGSAIRIRHPECQAHISISHDDGLSIAAISPHEVIGADVVHLGHLPDEDECLNLAWDYLRPTVAEQLTRLPTAQRKAAFAHAWTAWEAALKCRHLGISEWTAALQIDVEACRTLLLDLPEGYCGTLAIHTPKP